MYALLAILFNLCAGASVLLGVTCVVRRSMLRSRTRRWVTALERASIDEHIRLLFDDELIRAEAPAATWEHVVQFYGRDEELVASVGSYLSDGLQAGEATVVVASAEHRSAFEGALADGGVDVDAARSSGSYVALDAAETMAKFVVDGRTDGDLFASVVGEFLREMTAAGRPVRVYGEMVALLWDQGHVNAAVDLEGMWNELGSLLSFSLYCAYPTSSVCGDDHRASLEAVCHQHTAVVGSPSAPRGGALDLREPLTAV